MSRTGHFVWEDAFLKAFGLTGHVGQSAVAAGVDESTVRRARRTRPVFAKKMEEAKALACAVLEREAYRRAVEGWDEPQFGMVHGATEMVGVVRKYSDGLLTTLMKGNMPNKYRENLRAELTGKLEIASPAEELRMKIAGVAERLATDGKDVGS